MLPDQEYHKGSPFNVHSLNTRFHTIPIGLLGYQPVTQQSQYPTIPSEIVGYPTDIRPQGRRLYSYRPTGPVAMYCSTL